MPRNVRLYTLWKKSRRFPNGSKWITMGYGAYPKQAAVRMFQSKLIANALGQLEPDWEYQLRPIKQ